MPSRHILLFSIVILLLSAGLAAYSLFGIRGTAIQTGTGEALVGGPFTLVDQTGKSITDKDFRGKYMLIFFGYTYCPDVCPTELQVMMAAIDTLGPRAAEVQPIFITIDPDRDTPEVMQSYVENFGPSLVGLTGTAEQIAQVAKAYRVYYAKSGNTKTQDYLMDHSSIIYLMGPDGLFVKHFTYTTDAAALAEGIAGAMAPSP
ncbi:MAG: SCO family protein [Alphaproteobacteria bacterium]|nr:SCO family protein [Alphaproteobacteria bacterium]